MIVLKHINAIILTPPKTASSALTALCCEERNGIQVCGETDGCYDHHVTKNPPAFDSFTKHVVVRHPLDRLVSLWLHLVRWNARHGHGCCDFKVFAERVCDGEVENQHWIYHRTITQYLDYGGVKIDGFLRFETLIPDLEKLTGWKVERLPDISSQVSSRLPWREYYDEGLTAKVVDNWAGPDMKRFGYDLNSF